MTTIKPQQAERQRVLDDADQLISVDRDKEYGDINNNFANIAEIWAVIIGLPLTRKQVALMLAGLKVARLAHNPTHRDSWVDLAGYAALGAEVKP